tara:strand:- start:2432 stop:3172 length:741 start_codon:yes stop_codon:yes gene_type:complete
LQKSSKSLIKLTTLSAFLIFNNTICYSDDKVILSLEKKMSEIFPTLKFDKIKETGINNIYEVHYGGAIIYITDDGKYIFEGGNLQKVEKEGKSYVFINLTEAAGAEVRRNLLKNIPDNKLFVYGKSKEHYINVITDIDCRYCRKFHQDIPIYLENGIKVRYLVLARKKSSRAKIISAWCANNKNDAFTLLKNSKEIKKINCINPIDEHQNLINAIGTSTTPSIFLPDGNLISGYKTPKDIIEKIRD